MEKADKDFTVLPSRRIGLSVQRLRKTSPGRYTVYDTVTSPCLSEVLCQGRGLLGCPINPCKA